MQYCLGASTARSRHSPIIFPTILFALASLTSFPAGGQEIPPTREIRDPGNSMQPAPIDWRLLAESTLGRAVTDGETPGAAVVVVNRDETVFAAGFGVASLETHAAVTTSTLFEVGSLGKVVTAIAALQQVERDRLDLSMDVNSYLRDWKVDSPPDSAVTLHHLLTHSAGLNDRAIGYGSRTEDDVQPLGAHLAMYFPSRFAEPGQYISYSNYGFGLAGYLVETVTDLPFKEYVSSEILAPLGIVDSGYRTNIGDEIAAGYIAQDDRFVAAPIVYRSNTPAGSFITNARDMALLLRALINDGAPILGRESMMMMTESRQSQHPRLMGNAYGLEESRWGNLTAFGKGGSIPGFTAYMALIPDQDLGLFIAVNTASDAPIDQFIVEVFNRLSIPDQDLNTAVPIDASRFKGEYRSNRYDRTSVEKLLGLEIHDIDSTDASDLSLWHDGAMNTYRAVDSLVFQNIANTNRFLVFEEDDNGNITHAFFNDRIAGGYIPVVWERNGFWNSNKYVNEYFGIVLLVALSYLLFPFVGIARAIRRRKGSDIAERHGGLANITGVVTSALLFVYLWFYFIPLLRARPDLIFGIPDNLATVDILPVFTLTGFGAFAALWLREIKLGRKNMPGQVFGFIFLSSGVLLGEFLLRWNLL